jgi:hypothetical protein
MTDTQGPFVDRYGELEPAIRHIGPFANGRPGVIIAPIGMNSIGSRPHVSAAAFATERHREICAFVLTLGGVALELQGRR